MGYEIERQSIGDHEVTVDWHGLTDKAGDGSNIVINLRLKFQNGEVGNKDLYPCSSEKSLQITRKSLKAMGFDIDNRDISELESDHELLKGVKVKAVVEEQEYQGKVSNKITWINPVHKSPEKIVMANLTMKLRQVKKDNLNDTL